LYWITVIPGAEVVVWLEAIAHVAVVCGTAATTVLVETAPGCNAGARCRVHRFPSKCS
jgi:hypothetical protein